MRISRVIPGILLLLLAVAAAAHQGPHERLDRINHDIEAQPESQQLYLARGRLHLEMQRYEAAREDFDVAATFGKAEVVALDYGLLCHQMVDLKCAERQFSRYIESYPKHAVAYEYRARVFADLQQPTAALADLKRYFELADSPSPGLYIAASRISEQSGDPMGGLSIIDAGLARLGMVPQLQRRAVELELGRENTEAAIGRWALCRDVLQDSAEWKIEMARLRILNGQAGEARALLGEAKVQLGALRATPARIKSGEAIVELERQLQFAK